MHLIILAWCDSHPEDWSILWQLFKISFGDHIRSNLATTMPELEIKCPQPSRPLKRKGSHLELSAGSHEPVTKQPECAEARCRTPAPHAASTRTDERRPPIHQHLQESQPDFLPTLNANPTPAATPKPSALSFASAGTRQPSDITVLRPPTRSVTSPSYRQNLARHQVYIDSMGRNTPDDIRNWSSAILGKQSTSPGLSEDQVKDTQDTLCRLDCENEDGIKETLPTLPIFPPNSRSPLSAKVIMGNGMQLPSFIPQDRVFSLSTYPKPTVIMGTQTPRLTVKNMPLSTIGHYVCTPNPVQPPLSGLSLWSNSKLLLEGERCGPPLIRMLEMGPTV